MSRRPRGQARALAAALAAFAIAAVGGGGCSDEASYTYVAVGVQIDGATFDAARLALIASCEFEVRGAETDVGNDLGCLEGSTRPDLGTFQWATPLRAGTLQFIVTVFHPNRDVIGRGESPEVVLGGDTHPRTAITVVATSPP